MTGTTVRVAFENEYKNRPIITITPETASAAGTFRYAVMDVSTAGLPLRSARFILLAYFQLARVWRTR